MSRTIEKVREGDWKKFTRLNQRAYAGFYNGSKEETESASEVYKRICSFENTDGYGLYEGDKLIGGMIFYVFDYNFHGTMIKMAGIGSVAVDLLHKKEKVARDLIMFSLDLAKKLDIPLFTLYPFRADFYRNFGFGYGSSLKQIRTGPENFRDFDNKGILSEVDLEDLDSLIDYYNAYAKDHQGMTQKSMSDVRRFKGYNGATYLKAAIDGQICGYMVFNQASLPGVHTQNQKIEVQECLYDRKEALFAFSSFIHSQKDQVTFVEWHTFDDHLFRILDHIAYEPEERMMPMISQKFGDLGSGIMYMGLNIDYLLGLIFKGKNLPPIKWQVKMPNGSMETYEVCGLGEEIVDITVSLQGVSTWFSGAIGLEDLKWTGELDSANDLSMIDQVLDLKKPNFLSRF